MAEPLKKPGQQPEGYQPRKPEILRMAEQAQGDHTAGQERSAVPQPEIIIKKFLLAGFEAAIELSESHWQGMDDVIAAMKANIANIGNLVQPVRFVGVWEADPKANYKKKKNHSKRLYFYGVEVISLEGLLAGCMAKEFPESTFAVFRQRDHGEPAYEWLAAAGYEQDKAFQEKYALDIEIFDSLDNGPPWDFLIPITAPEDYQPRKPEIVGMAEQAQGSVIAAQEQPQALASGGEPPKTLRGVPKVHYGAFGGITPYPICLKAVSDYLGDELDYTYAMVASGGAFRFAWNTAEWDGGNVDIALAYADTERPYRQGIEALGREFHILWRADNAWGHPGAATKEDVKAFIREQIDAGRPVISLGPIGPAEAGIITGYSSGGDTLLGWSLFQWDGDGLGRDEEGYFITDKYWDEGDFVAVMSLGDVAGPRFGVKEILRNAIDALEGRQEGNYAKGVAAYEAWKAALLIADKSDRTQAVGDGGNEGMFDGMNIMMMCQGDATDCLIDGRSNACKYFNSLAEEHPEQPIYAQIAEQFGIVAGTIQHKIYKILGGHQRDKKQIKALQKLKIRQKIAGYIDEMKAADETALALMKELLAAMEG